MQSISPEKQEKNKETETVVAVKKTIKGGRDK